MKILDLALSAALAALVGVHLVVAPHTKVEESFNMQATHDVLVYGTPTGAGYAARLAERYDHATFPGAVPRTFVGAVVLAGLTQPLVQLAAVAGRVVDGPTAQLVVRGLLGLGNAGAMVALAQALTASCGRGAGRWYLVLQMAQFHAVFYASRTLPNMFAFFLTTLAYAILLGGSQSTRNGNRNRTGNVQAALALLVFAGIVFRAEVALLLVTLSAYLVAKPLASAERIVRTVLVAGGVALALSVPVDAYFWGTLPKPFWPELHGFLFNVVGGQASAWGTSPWHFYATSALPRLLLNPAIFALVPFALHQTPTRGPAALLVYPALAFVAVYSLQPHKEARFVLYAVPPLTAAAALGADQLAVRARKSVLAQAGVRIVVASTLGAFAAATGMLLLSSLNYPGGEALAALRDVVLQDTARPSAVVVAHADVLACMTGVTLFGSTLGAALPSHALALEHRAVERALGQHDGGHGGRAVEAGVEAGVVHRNATQLVVDKTEDARVHDPAFWAQFAYLLLEDPSKAVGGAWTTVAVVEGYAGVELLRPGQPEPTLDARVIGRGQALARARAAVRARTGGWWLGPRMAPRIHLLQRASRSDSAVVEHVS